MIRIPTPTFAVLTGLLAVASSAHAAGTTPAGTPINNQATATFDPLKPGEPTTSISNRVVTIVQAICAVSISSDSASNPMILPGEQSVLRFTVTNAGNDAFTVPLSASSTGTTPTPELTIYMDDNGNGQIDPGEQQVSSLTLNRDAAAKLLVLVRTSDEARGNAAVQLVSTCGAGEQVAATGTVSISAPPELAVTKEFSPAVIKPGDTTTVNVSTTNTGDGESREVILTDLLTDEIGMGLSFVMGSAQVNAGTVEYTTDGSTWSIQASAPVRGIRVRVPKLSPNAQILLSFKMTAAESADGKVIPNTALAQTGNIASSATAKVDVHYTPGVAIGPIGNPQAPEGTPTDSQNKTFAVVGQQICFDHTLQNTGDVQDTFQITVTYPTGGATSTLYGADGQPLTKPIVLAPGESTVVRICYTPTQTGPLESQITVTGARGTSNTTKDAVSNIQVGLPDLKKTYAAVTKDTAGNPKALADGTTVATGDTITYTLSVHNPYSIDLHDVVVSDPIPGHVDYVSASDGGSVSGSAGDQTVNWTVGTLAAGETRTYTIVTTVSDRAIDGEKLLNVFNMVSTELPKPTESNPVTTPVWNAALIIDKKVSAPVVAYGDRVTYTLKIRNASATTPIENAIVSDTPATGLQYIPGTSALGGAALGDPTITNGTMEWNAGTIPAGGEIVITYDMRVTPEATGDLLNVVMVYGTGAGGAARAIASNQARATTHLDPLKFAPIADLVGTVFVDRNRNGLYDAGLDTPVERARIILAGGRLALTDASGRYHYSNVAYGTQALRLDPNSVPYLPLKLPQEGGLSGTQTVQVRGLTSVDFPLAPLGGDVDAVRRTTLTMGDVTVDKAVYAVPGGYMVTLKVNTPTALPDFQLNDPLPGGATLKEGRNSLSGNLQAGESYLTYHFDWTGEPRAATTDPVVSWRY